MGELAGEWVSINESCSMDSHVFKMQLCDWLLRTFDNRRVSQKPMAFLIVYLFIYLLLLFFFFWGGGVLPTKGSSEISLFQIY